MTVVVDASVAVPAALTGRWPASLQGEELAAPTLLWSETTAALCQLERRAEIDAATGQNAVAWLVNAAIEVHLSRDLIVAARQMARSLGWAKTYDAEYVVLAERLRVPLITVDARLRTTASRLIDIRGPG